MEAQAAAQQLAQAAAQQAVLGCRSPVSVFRHNVLRWQMEHKQLLSSWLTLLLSKPSLADVQQEVFYLHIASSASSRCCSESCPGCRSPLSVLNITRWQMETQAAAQQVAQAAAQQAVLSCLYPVSFYFS
jgi:hypothetical protein